jgi:hypothetical protein
MDFGIIANPQNLKLLAKTSGINKKKKKNRSELILEPLQAILQLVFLSFSEKGTKISINNNRLYLQQPTYTQGIIRWTQNDNKNDISVLFYVCKRFPKYYDHLLQICDEDYNLYNILIEHANKGLINLAETYETNGDYSIQNNIKMYQLLLSSEIVDKPIEVINENTDLVFKKITEIYDQGDYEIIFNVLKKIIKCNNKTDRDNYINGLNKIIYTTTNTVHKWILNNLIF